MRHRHAAFGHGLLLLLVLAAATPSEAVATNPGTMKWRLPLGVGPNENTGTMSLAGDDSALYTADTRGTIFAIEARTGRLRWSIPGSDVLDQLFVFPSIPGLLYYTAWDVAVSKQLTLHAVRKEDGVEVARLRNLSTGDIFNGDDYAKVVPTQYGLAILHKYGLYSTDPYLNVQWKVDNPLGSSLTGQYFTHLAASGTLIATVARTEIEVEGRAVSFDAKTGRVVCDISDVTSTLLGYWGVPWVIAADGWSLMDYTIGDGVHSAALVPRAVDLQRCAVVKTERISDWALTWGVTIIPPTNYSDPSQETLFFGISRTAVNATRDSVLWGNWTITRSKIGSNDTIWNLTLPAAVGSTVEPLFLTKASGIPDEVLLWYLGSFSAIEAATGAVRWSLAPTAVPTSPPLSLMDPQTVFPLGDGGRLFIPNLLGYTIVNTYSGDVLEVNYDELIVATLQFRDGSGNGYVACVNAFGAVVGVH